jgi:hypothetical protein
MLLYSVYRYYVPSAGRFSTPDPVGSWFDKTGLGNSYAWVANRYRNARDALGLEPFDEEFFHSLILQYAVDVAKFHGPKWMQEELQKKGAPEFRINPDLNQPGRHIWRPFQRNLIEVDDTWIRRIWEAMKRDRCSKAAAALWENLIITVMHETAHERLGFWHFGHPPAPEIGLPKRGSSAWDSALIDDLQAAMRGEEEGIDVPWRHIGER